VRRFRRRRRQSSPLLRSVISFSSSSFPIAPPPKWHTHTLTESLKTPQEKKKKKNNKKIKGAERAQHLRPKNLWRCYYYSPFFSRLLFLYFWLEKKEEEEEIEPNDVGGLRLPTREGGKIGARATTVEKTLEK
jgi:hypothetical protein